MANKLLHMLAKFEDTKTIPGYTSDNTNSMYPGLPVDL